MRIASLSPAVTEILFAFGLQDQIVCRDQFSNYPEAAKGIAHVRDHQKVSADDLSAFNPEIVFTSTVVQEKLSEQLKEKSFTVIHQDPRTINAIYESIRQLGMLLQVDEAAEGLILQMQQGFNDVKKKAGLLPSRPKFYIEEWPAFDAASAGRYQPPFASGNWVPEVARIAGGQQYPIPAGELSSEVSLEDVQSFDPDMIIISWCGAGTHVDVQLMEQREGWGTLRAVREGTIRVIDDSLLNRPGPRLVEGAQRLYSWMFEELH